MLTVRLPMMRHTSGRLPSHRRGAALLELAVAIPFLLLLVVGTVDFGRAFYQGMALAHAARAGAEYGAQGVENSLDQSGMRTAAKTAVALDLALDDTDITPSRVCECATDAGVFSATSPANDCSGACAVGSHLLISVSVSVSKAFSTIVSYPRIPQSILITRSVKIRVQ